MEIKVGRPKGGRLTDEQRLESYMHTKEYQKKYRETHKSRSLKLKNLIQDIIKIKITGKDIE